MRISFGRNIRNHMPFAAAGIYRRRPLHTLLYIAQQNDYEAKELSSKCCSHLWLKRARSFVPP